MAYIAVDFDGTVVTHDFPAVGKDIGAVPVLKDLVKAGHKIILFTMRSHGNPVVQKGLQPGYKGSLLDTDVLDDAVNWFKDNGIPLFGINTNPTQSGWTNSPKVYCHVFIDDTACGAPLKKDIFLSKKPFIDWVKVREWLVEEGYLE
jgi:hypothetical protein